MRQRKSSLHFNNFQSAGCFLVSGREEGIRTLDTLFTYTRFPGVRLKPLIHLSMESEIIADDETVDKMNELFCKNF